MEHDSLEEIIRLCQQGRPEAFHSLLREFGPKLYRFFLRTSGSVHDAEDLLQDIFVKLLEKIKDYQHQGRFESWLFCVAANMVRDRSRKKQRRGTVVPLHDAVREKGQLINSIEASVPEPIDQLEKSEEYDSLQQALAMLPDSDKEIIMLRHYGGLSFQEIAGHFQIPIGTALTRVHRGLKKLKKIMEKS
ncbi:MAG: RNA polymerase sigma factor [Sedimentisphaerales bacterium]|nr:RNA polymerase sigma factor [Sedimentisphaerales bacterium]